MMSLWLPPRGGEQRREKFARSPASPVGPVFDRTPWARAVPCGVGLRRPVGDRSYASLTTDAAQRGEEFAGSSSGSAVGPVSDRTRWARAIPCDAGMRRPVGDRSYLSGKPVQ